MRFGLILFIIFFSLFTNGQDTLSIPHPFEFKNIDTIKGAKKEELFIKAKSWIVNYFVSVKAVIQVEDKEAGKIIGKGIFLVPHQAMVGTMGDDNVSFVFTLDLKDERYRIVFTDFFHEDGGGDLNREKPKSWATMTGRFWIKTKQILVKKTEATIQSLHSAMIKNTEDF